LIADAFGSASFGTTQGVILLGMTLLSAVAIRFAGEVYDRTGSYAVVLEFFATLSVIAVIGVLMYRRSGPIHEADSERRQASGGSA
jgi:cyanate permease